MPVQPHVDSILTELDKSASFNGALRRETTGEEGSPAPPAGALGCRNVDDAGPAWLERQLGQGTMASSNSGGDLLLRYFASLAIDDPAAARLLLSRDFKLKLGRREAVMAFLRRCRPPRITYKQTPFVWTPQKKVSFGRELSRMGFTHGCIAGARLYVGPIVMAKAAPRSTSAASELFNLSQLAPAIAAASDRAAAAAALASSSSEDSESEDSDDGPVSARPLRARIGAIHARN